MTHEIEDWKVTMYALGELEGEDRAAIDRAVAEDPELAARVEAIRRQAEDVALTLAAEPLPEPRPRYVSGLPRRLAALATFAAIFVMAWGASWGAQRPRATPVRPEQLSETQRHGAVIANSRAHVQQLRERPPVDDAQSRLAAAEKNLVDLEKQYVQKVKELEEAHAKLPTIPGIEAARSGDFEKHARKTMQLFQQAQDAIDRGNHEVAQRLCDDILSYEPGRVDSATLNSILGGARGDDGSRTLAQRQLDDLRREVQADNATKLPEARTILFPSHQDWEKISNRVPRSFDEFAAQSGAAAASIDLPRLQIVGSVKTKDKVTHRQMKLWPDEELATSWGDRFEVASDNFHERSEWGTDANEDLFGGRDITVTTRAITTSTWKHDSMLDSDLAPSNSQAYITADCTLTPRWVNKGYMRVAPADSPSFAMGIPYAESGETGWTYGLQAVVDGKALAGPGQNLRISGGVDIDSVWRADETVAILNRECSGGEGIDARLVYGYGDFLPTDGTTTMGGITSERTDDRVRSFIGLQGTAWSPQPASPMSWTMDCVPPAAVLGAITVTNAAEPRGASETPGTEAYAHIVENPFMRVLEEPLSTFGVDVDTASYAIVRRHLRTGKLPPPDAVRIEELVNYFPYDYAPPTNGRPFAIRMEMASCPWNKAHRLLRVGLKGRVPEGDRPASNLVFLIDVSGSMDASNKLPLVKAGLRMLVKEMTPRDRIAIVTYAGESGLALPSTPGDQKRKILDVLESLRAGGSTNGASGVDLAYQIAANNLVPGGTNRVILATDGDWNVGVTSHGDLVRLIEEKAKTGVFLTVLGFGMGNLKDDTLEKLADKGNGNYAYIDTLSEAGKVLVEEMGATLMTIAKDVKVQVEFNPARVAGYRLIGYENRALARQDFADDKKDAGEIGAGHTVTALYEVIPVGEAMPGDVPPMPPLRYQTQGAGTAASNSTEACLVKLRYKAPDKDTSELIEVPFEDKSGAFDEASEDFRFATAVAGYGLLLRRSQYAKGFTWEGLVEIAEGSLGRDEHSYRAEFVELVRLASGLAKERR